MPVGTVVVVLFAMVFGVGALAILMEHLQKMARIRADARAKANRQLEEALQAIRQEVAELRDTTTRYDLSFDTALQRMEARIARLEQGAGQAQSTSQRQG